MTQPTRLRGRKPVQVPLHSVMDVLSEVHRLGHFDKLRSHASDQSAFVTIHPKTVNLVKDYLATNNLSQDSAVADSVVRSKDPFNCDPP